MTINPPRQEADYQEGSQGLIATFDEIKTEYSLLEAYLAGDKESGTESLCPAWLKISLKWRKYRV